MLRTNIVTIFRMSPALALAATALAFATPAQASNALNDSKPTQAAAGKPAPKVGPKTKFCVKTEYTGSRLAKTECRTKAEWNATGVDIEAEM